MSAENEQLNIDSLGARIEDINLEIANPETARDNKRMRELVNELNNKKELLGLMKKRGKCEQEIRGLDRMSGSQEDEMRSLVDEEKLRLTKELENINSQIEEFLIERDPRDERDVILEIRAGTGGEESALFAQELFRAYSRYAEEKGWKVHTVSKSMSEQGGVKEVIAEIKGEGVFGKLKHERGVHRVQRVPQTEKQGRVHTSTVTVAVLPQAEETDIEIKPEDLRVDTYRAGGAGGQHVNKTSSAVRITHLPTGTVVAVQDERSQYKNKAKAVSILRSRLLDRQEEEKLQKEAQERRQQVGTGGRSEKIRTYNFPQDRVTDHRLKQSWKNIASIMEGQMEAILESLAELEKEPFNDNKRGA